MGPRPLVGKRSKILSGQLIAERGGLEKKDKSELQAIVSALGGKPSSRLRKSELIDKIIELSGAEFPEDEQQQLDVESDNANGDSSVSSRDDSTEPTETTSAPAPEPVEESEPAPKKEGRPSKKGSQPSDSDEDPNKRRRRGRGRSKGREDAGNDPIVSEPFAVEGFLELRDEGYGFLRVNSFLPSREDVYVSVKQVRQYGLRKGDHLTGLSRPASRNEKNAGFHQIDTVNGQSPEEARSRASFDELTPIFPDLEIQLQSEQNDSLAPRLVDLFAPLGRGQRTLVSAPAQSGATTFVKDLALSVEQNNPNTELLVLLVGQRPEETTWFRSELADGEVIASAYDRPPDEHCAIAEITIERAKRLVEFGHDVCLIIDGFTALAEAYQAVASNGRNQTMGMDATALHQATRLFGAARKLEQGGSLTIVATAQTNTESPDVERIERELMNGANAHILLDAQLAVEGVYPALDITASHTRREDVLLGAEQAGELGRLRQKIVETVLEDESFVAGTRKMHEQVRASETNDDFLADIMKTLS